MAHALGAKVIVLQSHPAWVGAQRRARERSQAIRRHPSCLAQQRRIAQGDIGQPQDRLPEPEAVLDDNSPRAALREL
jgi:hypothetical protein